MSERQRLDLENGRMLRKAGFDTVGRYLFNRPLDCGETAIGPDVLESAAELMKGTQGEYAPVVIELERYDGEEPDGATETLAFVNKEDRDDVIVLCPRLPVGGDDL